LSIVLKSTNIQILS